MTINSAKAKDTADLILGSGATSYEWYLGSKDSRVWTGKTIGNEVFKDWHITLLMEDPEDSDDHSVEVLLNHKMVMKWARHVVKNKGKEVEYRPGRWYRAWSVALEDACAALVFNVDDADFDAPSADELIQLAAYGRVVFA
jgi:hypothetical protein